VAATVGFMTLILAGWLGVVEKRKWVKGLGFAALGAVIFQGLLGGITVKFFLPPPVSILHGVLAQTFFILTVIIAYSLSRERFQRMTETGLLTDGILLKVALGLGAAVYLQLILGAVMRHTQSGLAIPDFPTIGGEIIPAFDEKMIQFINDARFEMSLEPVNRLQVAIHFVHRLWGLAVLTIAGFLGYYCFKHTPTKRSVRRVVFWLTHVIWFQVLLGILTVVTAKSPVLTSFHVMTGAATLGLSTLLVLRVAPLSLKSFRKFL